MKKITSVFFLVSLCISTLFFQYVATTAYAAESVPVRVINVVYDDSGSMIVTGGKPVDTWCQAKYSMEVFAALLGQNDTMNIYVMSEYDLGETADRPRLTLNGSAGPEKNVSLVHDMITEAGNTPFDAVRKAYDDLTVMNADEKWLVILTDGEFEDGAFTSAQVDEYLSQKQDDIRVMFLSMGASAASIHADEAHDIYFEQAETNDQILNKITEISTRIFNSNKLEVDVSTGRFDFDIPMSELVVFAQGDGVKINGIQTDDGQSIAYDKTPVSVRYSEKPSAKGYANFIVDEGLVGSIATFTQDFDSGTYTVDAPNAKTIEVYYRPNVEIMLFLVDEDGEEAAYTDGVRAGNYKIGLGFAKPGSSERLPESKLLGDIRYSAHVTFNGTEDPKEYKPGDPIVIEEGNYVIDAVADYLKYNSVATQIEFEVFRDKELVLTKEKGPAYDLDKDGFINNGEPITYQLTLEGEPISPEDWAAIETPVVEQIAHTDRRIDLKVEKGDEPGVILIRPELGSGKTTIGDYGSIDYRLTVSAQRGKSTWTGSAEDTCEINDLRSWFWKHIDKVIKGAIAAGIGVLLLGYVPGFKKRLPKKLKKAPRIECESNVGAHKQWEVKGRYTKNRLAMILPYKAETGTIKYLPRGVSAAPNLTVKAVGSNKMEITNTKSFAGKEFVTFNGMPVNKTERKKKVVTAGLRVKVETREANYTCILNK